MANEYTFGQKLQGIGAALSGTVPQFQQEMQQLDDRRVQAMYKDAGAAYQMYGQNNLGGIIDLANDRLRILQRLPGSDPSDTMQVLQLAQAARGGDQNAYSQLGGILKQAYDTGISLDILKPPAAPEEYTLGQGDIRFRGGQEIARGMDKPTAQMLSADAATNLGLDPNKKWQRSNTGLITEVGGSGQVINVGGTTAQNEIDKMFAQEYYPFITGGSSQSLGNMASIKTVLEKLELGENLTGPMVGLAPDLVRGILNPEAQDAKDLIGGVVQLNLREVLGGQFAQREGEQLVARAYNPLLPPENNARRLRKLFMQMETAYNQRVRQAEYFEQNGTLKGFKGELPKLSDFYDALKYDVGDVVGGFKFVGGDPSNESSWEKVE